MDKKIGFIGAGIMGGAIIGGIISSGIAKAQNVLVFDKNTTCVENLAAKYGIKSDLDLKTVSSADILFLAVKPSVIYDVIKEIKEYISEKVSLSWWCFLKYGSTSIYDKISFIQPIFHLKLKPKPPSSIVPVTFTSEEDSSAIISA